MSFYRIQDSRINTADLLNPELQISESYSGMDERVGVSVCGSLENLATYLTTAGSGIPFDTTYVVVEVTGYFAEANALDAEAGEYLIHPTEVVSVTPIEDELLTLIDAAYDALYA